MDQKSKATIDDRGRLAPGGTRRGRVPGWSVKGREENAPDKGHSRVDAPGIRGAGNGNLKVACLTQIPNEGSLLLWGKDGRSPLCNEMEKKRVNVGSKNCITDYRVNADNNANFWKLGKKEKGIKQERGAAHVHWTVQSPRRATIGKG